ncbi:dual oxidase 2-like isoform X2 [Pecten maximus]|uniref:dual oxidase 2-like isoform X2 n=1 Tax=Pecten maximus TaxID=6579 RepID=UPI001457F9B5|nr:dual oxidase 2-like isoform X2 [Pecten maximus]
MLTWALVLLLPFIWCQSDHEEIEYSPQDGWYNNPVHIDWGAIDGQLLRRSSPVYADGVYHMAGQSRPNPFEISRIAHSGTPGLGSARGRNAMLVYFGQQVVEEVLDSQRPGCPREFENVPIPKDHPYNPEGKDDLAMPFLRTRYDASTGYSPNNPRQQLNEITPYIDGTLIYGPARAWTDAIREFKGGRLKARDPNASIKDSFPAENTIRLPFANPPAPRQHKLRPVSRFLTIGNPRGNENPMLLTFAILFFRWHNKIAMDLETAHPTWGDEALFEEARKLVIAHHQNIVMYQWLPLWLEINNSSQAMEIPSYFRPTSSQCKGGCGYNGYSSEIHPGITQEFQTAAMRFGHTLVTPGLWLRGPRQGTDCNYKPVKVNIQGQPGEVHALRLCNSYWNSQDTVEPQLDDLIRGMTSTLAEKEDHIMVPDLRDHVFGPLDFSRRDLGAINIQRGRDHGIAGYNAVRLAYGLKAKSTWIEINPQLEEVLSKLQSLYGNTTAPDELDIFTGGLLETTEDGPGELFKAIMLDQFLRIRHGDRFWFENTDSRFRRFSDAEIAEIRRITLRDIILNVTNVLDTEISADVFLHKPTDPCPQPEQLKADTNQVRDGMVVVENCTTLQHYDYFYGSEASFALTFLFLGLCVPGVVGIMLLMVKMRQRRIQEARRVMAPKQRAKSNDPNSFDVVEWMGPTMGERRVKVKFDKERKKIHVTDTRRKPLRMLDLRKLTAKIHFRTSRDRLRNMMSIRLPNEIDLVLRFGDEEEREAFTHQLEAFLQEMGINREVHEFDEKSVFDLAETKEERQKILDTFFRVICVQAFDRTPGQMNLDNLSADDINKVQKIQLTRTEFSEALGLKPTSVFVRNMFLLVDADNSGTVSFQEFLDMFIVMSSGDADDKAMLMFNMYDLRRRGYLTRSEFVKMIKSLLDLSDQSINDDEINSLIDTMFMTAGLSTNQNIDLDAFKRIFASEEHKQTLESASLGIGTIEKPPTSAKAKGGKRNEHRKTFLQSYKTGGGLSRSKTMVRVKTVEKEIPPTRTQQKMNEVIRYIENYKRHIFWVTLYTLVLIGVFSERAYYYSVEREHAGLRRIAGYGVTITRGAASAMMFTYSSLLVTMSRNVITFLRETFLHTYIPFDSAIAFHKLIAAYALFFTVMHCVGHGINLYHISTQASTDLNCVFREYFRATDILASFQYWTFETITGFTGVILTLIIIIMYVFAIPYARRNLFNAFWFTHNFYILLYIFLVLHGSGRLVQSPLFQNFFYGPLVIYVIDKLISVSRKKREISVIQADLLPSDVTGLKFKRPLDFEYKSGQWVRIACLDIGEDEYHPFTLTSAPHEDFLSLHIRAVGPWTINLRSTYDPNNLGDRIPPKVYVDGPFGEGHQDWYKYPVSVLVGGGIGVTPFASILKDIVHRSQTDNQRMACQKVYFLWVTRTQKQFEWLTDIIRDVENADRQELVAVHIFITQFQQKFDLRTTMLYICERHFHKVAGKSLFTGLSATTHFGRPQFQDFLTSLSVEHRSVKQVGVFSCGPPPMTLKVDRACTELNKNIRLPTYSHHFENF